MRDRLLFVALALAAALGTTSAGTASSPVTATLVGDSVAASIGYTPSARDELRRGVVMRIDAAECRRLVQPSCAFRGEKPTTALQAVRGYGRSLGSTLVVDVGYNESSSGYAQGIDRVVRAALAQGARSVVWVTLRAASDLYRQTNAAIARASKRWAELRVADWNAYSRGKPWFIEDALHLTATGAAELAAFIRRHVLQAARRS